MKTWNETTFKNLKEVVKYCNQNCKDQDTIYTTKSGTSYTLCNQHTHILRTR